MSETPSSFTCILWIVVDLLVVVVVAGLVWKAISWAI